MTYALPVHIKSMDAQLDQVARNTVAAYQLDMAAILHGTGLTLSNPFPLYWPGMPAYDAARKQRSRK